METAVLDLAHGVGESIRTMRVGAGLSQHQLAERLATTQSAVSRWERDHDEPRLSTLASIARACGRSARVVFDDDVDRAQIREHLRMSPVDRLRSVANVSALRSAAQRADRDALL